MQMAEDKIILSVDPGVGGTGWALFEKGTLRFAGTIVPKEEGDEWIARVFSVSHRFQAVINCYPSLDSIVMECPAFHGGAAGMVVAAKGDLVKLSLLTGALLHVCYVEGFTPALVKPAEWKGQLPKKVAHDRIKDILKMQLNDLSEHAKDAVGIGLWSMGRF